MKKKVLGLFLSLVMVVTTLSAAVLPVAAAAPGWSDWVALSSGATISESDSSWSNGAVTFKVTLPASGGYAQLQQPLSALANDGSFQVKVEMGTGTTSDYENANVNVQLTADGTAATDCVPVNENTSPAPSDAMSWLFYGTSSTIWFNTGSATAGSTNLATPANTVSSGLRLNFTKTSDEHVTATYVGIAGKERTSRCILSDIGAEDGVYVRVRNAASSQVTVTVTVTASELSTVTRTGNFIHSKAVNLVSSNMTVANGETVYTYTAELGAGGQYIQFDKKLVALANDKTLGVKIVLGSGTGADYAAANLNVQLTADSTAGIIIPVENEYLNTPDTTGMTWVFQGYNNLMYFNTGGYLGGATDLATPANTASTGLRLNFTKDEDGYVTGTYVGVAGKYRTSKRTLTEIGADDGVYLRIRNAASSSVTVAVTITVPNLPHTDGLYQFSDENSTLTSSSTSTEGTNVTQTATFQLAGNSSYVQFNRKLTELITGNALDVKVVIGDGTSANYQKTNLDLQLTADSTAATDLTPIVENGKTADQIPTDALSFGLLYYSNNNIYLAKGLATTTGATPTAAYTDSIFTTDGLKLTFTKNSDGTVDGSWKNGSTVKSRTSVHTLAEIGGDHGVYVRLRNNASETITFTMTITYSEASYTDGLYKFSDSKSGLLSYTTTTAGTTVTQTATFQLTGAGAYAQLDRKLTELITGNAFDVKVVIGDGTSADYQNTNLDLQLTADSTAATDLTPIMENGKTADQIPTDALSFGLLYYSNNNIYLAKGLATTTGATPTAAYTDSIFTTDGLKLTFTKNSDGTVDGSWKNGSTVKSRTSVHTLAEIGGDHGVYVRLRNNANETLTYTMTITYSIAPYTDGLYKFSDADSGLISSSTSTEGTNVTQTATFQLAGNGGYAQLDRKLTDFITGGAIDVKVVVGNGESADYAATNLDVQLTADSAAQTDLVPVNENATSAPTDAISWLFYGTSSTIWFHTGSGTAGSTNLATPANTVPTGLRLQFTKDADNYVTGSYVGIANKTRTSKRTLAEIGGDRGVYVRLRNNASQATTYTITVTYSVASYTDGAYKFSNGNSVLLSSSSTNNGTNIVRTATVELAADGGYVQLDRQLTDLAHDGSFNVKVIVGDGTDDDYAATNFNIQLTSDQAATSDIVPVNEYSGATPSTSALTWKVLAGGGYVYYGWGANTSGGTYFNRSLAADYPSGLSMSFTKTEDNMVKLSGGWARSLTSKQTLSYINGDDGVYVRIRNPKSTPATYTVVVTSSAAMYQQDLIRGNTLTLNGQVGVNFVLNTAMLGNDLANTTVNFAWAGKNETLTSSDFIQGAYGIYAVCEVSAKEMNETITITAKIDDRTVLTRTYSVATYANRVIANENNEFGAWPNLAALQNLMKSMLIYGAKAQLQFNYNTSSLADAGLTYTLPDVGALSRYTYKDNASIAACGLKYMGCTLVLKSKTSFRLFFEVTDAETANAASITLGGKTLGYEDDSTSGLRIYTIDDIAAADLLDDIVISFNGASVTFNAGTYISKKMDGDDATLKNVLKALYDYNQKAVAYFG